MEQFRSNPSHRQLLRSKIAQGTSTTLFLLADLVRYGMTTSWQRNWLRLLALTKPVFIPLY
ncbi:MAG: hypothetical protein CMJ77_16265 [Planctomycetaceae bacterium]|nr:hypothetical protein [Planctomycetaceae bacterium]